MTTFIEIILGFPTVLFTVPLVFAAFYWTLAIVGAVDMEIFDGLDGALDGAVDGVVDGVADAVVEGVAEATGDAMAESAADAAGEAADAAEGGVAGPLVLLASILRVGKLPITVSLSTFILWGWVTGFLLTWFYRNIWGIEVIPLVAFSVGAMTVAIVFGLAITNLSVRPLEPLFQTAPGRKRDSVVGESAELTTGRVDATFGQATVQMKGDDLVFQVRCDQPGNGLVRGGRVLVVHYDRQREAYIVEPLTSPASRSARSTQADIDAPSTHRSLSESTHSVPEA